MRDLTPVMLSLVNDLEYVRDDREMSSNLANLFRHLGMVKSVPMLQFVYHLPVAGGKPSLMAMSVVNMGVN